MRQVLRNASLALALTLGLCADFSAKVQEGRQTSATHAAAVKRCKDNYNAALRAAKEMRPQQAQQQAVAAAKRDYDDCLKSASKVP